MHYYYIRYHTKRFFYKQPSVISLHTQYSMVRFCRSPPPFPPSDVFLKKALLRLLQIITRLHKPERTGIHFVFVGAEQPIKLHENAISIYYGGNLEVHGWYPASRKNKMAAQNFWRTFSGRKNSWLFAFYSIKRNKNTMKIPPAIVYRLANGFLILN